MTWFFGDYLQRFLDDRDWTASKLAKKAKLSHVYMGTLLRGDRTTTNKLPRISVETVTALAKALGIPEYMLLLAYKGIDPAKASSTLFPTESFNIYAEIHAAASRRGVDLYDLPLGTKNLIESNILHKSRRYIDCWIEEELVKLQNGA